jgi:hypothetical protein
MTALWRVYYEDGSTFSDEDGPAQDAAGLGVLCIVQWDDQLRRKEILHGDGPRIVDWYWWEAENWLCGDMAGLVQYLAAPGAKKILVGRNMPNAQFRAVMKQAADDTLGH